MGVLALVGAQWGSEGKGVIAAGLASQVSGAVRVGGPNAGHSFVHNGKLCKEVGYYYDEFHYEMGGEVLKDAILNHDKNAHEYLVRNRAYMQKYLPTNTELKSQYEILISNVLART